jgi:CRP-like cAMP-binding protein
MSDAADPTDAGGLPLRGWIAQCDPEFRRALVTLARPKAYSAGHLIYQTGERSRSIFGIRRGVVALQGTFTHPDGVALQLLRAGEWFGTLAVLGQRTRRFSATARTDLELLVVPADDLHALLRSRPEWFAEVARDAVYALEIAMQAVVDLLIRDSSARCAAVLLRMAGRRWRSGPDEDQPAEIPTTQAEIAMLCNVSKTTYGRVMKRFADDGLITPGYKTLRVDDPARLRAIAESG